MKEEIIKTIEARKDDTSAPSPIEERECSCGCGVMFIPKRKDQKYFNRQHANFGYNHGRRKILSARQITAEKGLRKNDKLLNKFWCAHEETEVIVPHLNLKVDGFNFGLRIGIEMKGEDLYYKTYNYLYHIYEVQGVSLVKIHKQKIKIRAKH